MSSHESVSVRNEALEELVNACDLLVRIYYGDDPVTTVFGYVDRAEESLRRLRLAQSESLCHDKGPAK